ncbi:MAG: hypothetical protein WCO68_01545 [Verrucomicrobiota bacterium]
MKRLTLLAGLLLLPLAATSAATDEIKQGFLNPPESAKPQTWWHWMNDKNAFTSF